MAQQLKKVVVESAEAVLGLHWFVARDFTAREEGFEIEIITPGIKTRFDWSDPRSSDHRLVDSTNYQKAFEEGRADVYRACEWGQVRRTYDHKRKGPIAGKRAAMVYQGVYVRPDSSLNTTVNLAKKRVGVQYHQGSHYTTLAMLEGFLPRDDINVVHAGTVQERYEAMMSGEVDAATLMEPWITLAEKNGCKLITGTYYQGLENVAAELDAEAYKALVRAVKNAVVLINRDALRYVHYMMDEIPEQYASQLKSGDFNLGRLRYVDPAPYTEEEFSRVYNWMLSWELVGRDADYSQMVQNMH